MAQTIKLKRSATQNAVPSTSSLALGEVAINTYDGKLFIKKNVSGTESIVTIGELSNNSVTSAKIATDAVGASEIAANSVGISELNVSDGSSGQVLTTDGSGNLSFSTVSSGSQNTFQTISVSGQSDVEADSSSDTLTLAAGSGMTITTNASTDTVTFASTATGLSSNAVTSAHISSNAVLARHVAANAIGTSEVAANSIGISELNVTDGTNGQALITDGSGSLSFSTISGSGGGGQAQALTTDTFSPNGSTSTFSLSATPSAEGKVIAFIDGVFQNQDSYTLSGSNITFDTNPSNGTKLVVYVVGDIYGGTNVNVQNFSGDGSTAAFTLTENPGNENNTQIYVDGVYQQKTTYSVSGTTLTFTDAPPSGTNNIEVITLSATNLGDLQANSATASVIASNAVLTRHIAGNAVGASEIAANTITSAHIGSGVVIAADVADGAITAAKLATDSVTGAKIAANAVGAAEIAKNAVDSAEIVSGSIDTAHLGNSQVTTAKLADDSVTAAKIADNSVGISALNVSDGTSGQFLSTNGSGTLSFASATSTIAGATDTSISSPSGGQLLIYDGTNSWDNISLSGDATLAANGTVTISANAVSSAEISANAITSSEIAASGVTAGSYGSSSAIPVLTVDADGRITSASTASTSSTLTIAADSGSNDTVTVGTDTLTFAGTSNEIETTVSNNQIQIGLPDNVTITGNLTVNGSTVTNSATNTTIEDLLIELGTGTTGTPSNDAGIVIERGSSDNAFIGWDESEDKFTLGTGSFTGASSGNLSITTGTLVANLEGAVTGNASTATTLATSREIALTGDVTASGVSFDGSGNISLTTDIGSNKVGITELNVSDGTSGQALVTDGSGTLSFATVASSLAGASDTSISSPSSGQVLVYDGSNSFDNVSVSGDATLAANGALTIGANTVNSGKIASNSILTRHIDDNQIGIDQLNVSDGTNGQVLKTNGSGTLSFGDVSVSGSVVNNYTATGDGSTTDFDTGTNPQNENNTWVFVGGVYQPKSSYSYSSTTISFSEAPPNGEDIEIITGKVAGFDSADTVLGVYQTTTTNTATYDTGLSAANENNTFVFIEGVYQPKDTYSFSGTSITLDATPTTGLSMEVIATKTLSASAVTTNTIADNNVTSAKIASDAILARHIAANAVTSSELAKNSVTADEIATNAVTESELAATALSGQNMSGNIAFDTNTLYIDSTNNRVGVGTASPGIELDVHGLISSNHASTPYFDLKVSGTMKGRFYADANQAIVEAASDKLILKSASTTAITIDSSQNVGIGETSPLGKLHIKGTDTGATASAQGNSLILEDTENGLSILSSTAGAGYINFGDSGDNNIGMIIYDHSSNSMRFSANAAERMRIDASGNVGIGTTSPSTPLHVKTNSSGYALTIEENSGGEAYQIGTDQYGGLVFYNSTTKVVEFTDSSEMQLYSGGSVTTKISPSSTSYFTGGNVGIGTTSPTEKLTVAGAITATGALADDRTSTAAMDFSSGVTRFVSYGDATQDGAIAFRTATGGQSSTERMRIDVNGNVGIGTNSPGGRKLSVQKDTTITSGFNDITEFLDTTIGGGGSVSLNVGRANSTRNLGKMAFKFAGAGSTSNALNFGFYDADNLMTLTAGGSVGIGNSSPGFKLTIGGGIGANSSTAYASMTGQIGFGNDYSDTQRGPNKIVLQNDGAWIAGLGISDNSTDFYSGGNMSFRAGTSLGSERMKIHSNGLIQIDAGANTTGLCINETDVRISNNQTNYGKYKIAAAHVSGGTAHLGRKCANGYSTNALIAEYWGVEEVWAKGAIAYKRISSYDQGEFQWWLNATSSGAEVSSSDTKMRLERTGALHINGSLTQNASDERMKENITLIPNALDKVTQLRGVSFTWKEIENSPHEAGTEDIGVIAQDVEAVLPLIVKPAPFDTYTNTTDEGDEETKETTEVVSRSGKNYKTVEYEKLVPLLIESVKELKTELDAAKARITELEA